MKNQHVALLLTDAQIPNERFLVIINDLLASGQIQTPYYTVFQLYLPETKSMIVSCIVVLSIITFLH